jgi:thiamine-phosphate pyrophosphorylase
MQKTCGCLPSPKSSIINDRVDIAAAAGADGVHLGQDDLPVEQARKLQLAPLIIGKSTHSIEQLQQACRQNPAYVSLGPIFATATKPTAEVVGIDYVKQAAKVLSETGIRGVAIGGITEDNVDEVLSTGIKTVAVCSAVTCSPDPEKVCRKLKEKIEDFSK